MPTIKITYEHIQARITKLKQDIADIDHLLSKQEEKGNITIEVTEEEAKRHQKPAIDRKKLLKEKTNFEAELDKWEALEAQHRQEPKHYIDEMLEGLPDDTELYQDLQQAKQILT